MDLKPRGSRTEWVRKPRRLRASPLSSRRVSWKKKTGSIDLVADPQTDVAPGWTRGRHVRSRYRCSMCSAIHINSRSWLRSSSTHEPSDPPPKVVFGFFYSALLADQQCKNAQCVQNENKREDKGRPTANWSDSLNLAACSEAGAPASTRL